MSSQIDSLITREYAAGFVTEIEEDTLPPGLDEDSVAALVERALYDAEPLSKNAYKLQLAAALLRDTIRELAQSA